MRPFILHLIAKPTVWLAVLFLSTACGDDGPSSPQASYTVGGSISGLSGSGLTLRLNGGTPLAIQTGATTFSFPSISSGSSFTVTVGSQPTNPSQICTISNGSGTVGSANITSVAVSCVSLTIGGTVSGLTGSGLSLRLNGGTPMAIASGTTAFTFSQTMTPDADYVVTVSGQPGTPVQSCTIIRAQGRITNSPITNIAVQCTSNTTSVLSGTYNPAPNVYLTFWPDGTFAYTEFSQDPGCGPSNGNGIEYGIYTWNSANSSFSVPTVGMAVDGNGECGLSKPGLPPTSGITITKSGTTLTINAPGAPAPFVVPPVTSTAGTLVGAFVPANGNDGSFIVFNGDGTYFSANPQAGTGNGAVAGFERGCYSVSGSNLTAQLAAPCNPGGGTSINIDGTSGFSARLNTAIPFQITGQNALTIGGLQNLVRHLPN